MLLLGILNFSTVIFFFGLQLEDCIVCSDKPSRTLFKPCNHLVACEDCDKIMKKCVECRAPIEDKVPFKVLCGGKIGKKSRSFYSVIGPFAKGSLKIREKNGGTMVGDLKEAS